MRFQILLAISSQLPEIYRRLEVSNSTPEEATLVECYSDQHTLVMIGQRHTRQRHGVTFNRHTGEMVKIERMEDWAVIYPKP